MNNHKKSNREYYQRNKERECIKRRLHYQQHREEEKAKAKEYRSKHPELKEKRKLYTQKNRERLNVSHRQWREKNKEKTIAYEREYSRIYRPKNKDKINRLNFKRRARIKIAVLTHYGNNNLACVLCGENRLPCLSIHHINNEGAKERREIKPQRNKQFSGIEFYSWLIKEGFPGGYQTLCMNCQWVKKADYEKFLAKVPEQSL